MKTATWIYVAVALLLAALVASDAASYRKRLPLEVRMHVLGYRFFEVPEATRAHGVSGIRLGYKCNRAGILASDVAVWNCHFAEDRGWGGLVISGEKGAALAARYPETRMVRGSWNRFGAFSILLAPVVFALLMWLARFPVEAIKFRFQLRALRRQAALKEARQRLRLEEREARDPLCPPEEKRRRPRKHHLPETDEVFIPGLVEPILKYWSDWTPDPYGTPDPYASTSGSKS